MKIWLADINKELCDEWVRDFREYPDVAIHNGSMFEVPANTIVSPANSFGFMTGGVDLAISDYLGWHVQERLQEQIKKFYDGELLVGQTVVIETDHEIFPYLISAPTMRVPSLVDGTVNAYLATKATLRCVEYLSQLDIEIIPVFTGMGTGTGQMNLRVCSRQMLEAYEEILGKSTPEGLRDKGLRQRSMER